MGESLTERRRVEEEGLRVVNSCQSLGERVGLIPRRVDKGLKGSHS